VAEPRGYTAWFSPVAAMRFPRARAVHTYVAVCYVIPDFPAMPLSWVSRHILHMHAAPGGDSALSAWARNTVTLLVCWILLRRGTLPATRVKLAVDT
jgi:hypothetical protein